MSKSVLRPTRIAAAVCSIFLVSHAARAEDAPAPAPVKANSTSAQAPVMQTVMVKGSAATYDARRDDTASKVVVNSEEIQKYGDTSVNDVLKRLPGITVGGAALDHHGLHDRCLRAGGVGLARRRRRRWRVLGAGSMVDKENGANGSSCLLYTSPSPRDS